ncbi:hypothetical protein [Carboxylicivirga sp. M1479]|uniref:hypothetical protein n=1 Tax=Carboxylicivirga sp. M1479 TaxID=2594476 RepID=UPI0011777D6A|nr:hypothetical protein [Carboxylicivirga sp. M1479]TRX70652.1 hypothetical protein FNN09_10280 [Carboxylicivirga sp. M1479]
MRSVLTKTTFCLLTVAIAAFILSSCNSSQKKQKSDEQEIVETVVVDDKLVDGFKKSKLIFYSLPSPLETAMLIKRAGATYNEELLNPLSNIEKYSTNRQKALNLGVYSADLSYTSLFDQTQSSIKYMANAKRLADGLGIIDAIDEETMRKLEENVDDRDVMLDIISETFMSSNAYLTENDRPAIAVMVLVGGWVEGLYLATRLTNGSVDNNKRLIDRIVYQKLSLYTVINLLEEYKSNEDVNYLLTRISELNEIFEQVEINNTSKVEAETNAETRVTTIKAESEAVISPVVFEKLMKKVEEIRNEFVS